MGGEVRQTGEFRLQQITAPWTIDYFVRPDSRTYIPAGTAFCVVRPARTSPLNAIMIGDDVQLTCQHCNREIARCRVIKVRRTLVEGITNYEMALLQTLNADLKHKQGITQFLSETHGIQMRPYEPVLLITLQFLEDVLLQYLPKDGFIKTLLRRL